MSRKTISLRRPYLSEIDTIVDWFMHPSVAESVGEHDLDKEDLKEFFSDLATSSATEDGKCGFVVIYEDKPICFVHVMWINWISRTGELDLFMNPFKTLPPFMRTSMFRSVMTLFFTTLNLNKMYSFVYESNQLASRLFGQFMVKEATLQSYLNRKNQNGNVQVFGLTKNDYLTTRSFRAKEGI